MKFKLLFKYIVYRLIDFSVIPAETVDSNSLLLIRLDAIGDYILFRNFIRVLKQSKRYRNYKITFLGNVVWRDLAIELDGEYVDRFIWIDKNKFYNDFGYRYGKLKEIATSGYGIVLNPVLSREFFVGDNIVKLVYAEEKIGSIGDLTHMKRWQKKISDKYYTRLIDADEGVLFEFYRNKEFFENLLGNKLDIEKPTLDIGGVKLNFKLPRKYTVLFMGSGQDFRKWNVENFVKIGEALHGRYELEVVLCGAPNDLGLLEEFEKFATFDYINLIGKTSLLQLVEVVAGCQMLVSNETSAPHIAVASGVKNIFVISNGNHFGRFTPYPKEMVANYHVSYPPEIEKELDRFKMLTEKYGYGSDLDINQVEARYVMEKIEKAWNAR